MKMKTTMKMKLALALALELELELEMLQCFEIQQSKFELANERFQHEQDQYQSRYLLKVRQLTSYLEEV
jgi:hypothetical protein